MSVGHLPNDPSLERLRNEARDLQRSARAGKSSALALVRDLHPGAELVDTSRLRLSAAQLVVARRYGFTGWPALKRHLDLVKRYSWVPDAPGPATDEPAADRLCRLACLCYQEDGPSRWAAARRLLAEQPALSGAGVWAAAVTSDLAATERLLADDPSLASRRGGPFGWCPLAYLAYSRLDATIPAEAVLGVARMLLEAGADPNEGYLWHGMPPPFTLLTGVFGHGELGPASQPAHPQSIALARMLLDAGADPNDGQALYNRMFQPDDDHLELLLEYGLGTGDGGPWKARLGDALASPPQMLAALLDWAVSHNQPHRVKLLVEHGVDLSRSDADGHTAAEAAALSGNAEIAGYLTAHGAPPLALADLDAAVAAIMSGDHGLAQTLDGELVAELRRRQPYLIVWAAAQRRLEAVRMLIELGWDVNAFGRGDVPSGTKWQTALHQAAGDGDLDLIRLLLVSGADPNLRDHRFGGTPVQWAAHFGHQAAIELLAPLSEPYLDPGPA